MIELKKTGCKVEEFDIDAQINKIKAQMGNMDNSIFRDDFDLPSDEPSLGEIASEEPTLEEVVEQEPFVQETEQISDVQETDFQETNAQESFEEHHVEPTNRFFEPLEQEPEVDPFGEIEENNAVKKYVIYVSQDFVPYIDEMDADARSAYINEALQIKQDYEAKENKLFLYIKLIKHAFVCVLTLIFAIPALFWLANKSIIVTKENYSYVQKNFEKLYDERADRSRTIKVLPKKKRY